MKTGICAQGDRFVHGGAFGAERTTTRRQAIEQNILNKGYSTNYTAHWYLVRGNPRVKVERVGGQASGLTVRLANPSPIDYETWKSKSRGGASICTGPLRRKDLQTSKIASAMIPLLGDGARGDPDRSVSTTDYKYRNRPFIAASDRFAESFGDGPATWYWSHYKITRLDGDAVVGKLTGLSSTTGPQWSGQLYEEWTGDSYGSVGLQDTRNINCYHLESGGSYFCPLLMADDSVRDMVDQDNDGFLNPGFPACGVFVKEGRSPAPFWDDAYWRRFESCGGGLLLRPHRRPPTYPGLQRAVHQQSVAVVARHCGAVRVLFGLGRIVSWLVRLPVIGHRHFGERRPRNQCRH